MPQFIQTYGFTIVILIFVSAMMWFFNRSRKKFEAQREAEQENLRSTLTPGQWVRTRVGFWGRYVDRDGDIIILETSNGTETYWELAMIASTGEPPFADDAEPVDISPALDEQVLGLDSPKLDVAGEEPQGIPSEESQDSSDADAPKTDSSTK